MHRYAAAALMDTDRRILLGLRSASRSFYPGVWDFIGGHCKEGETPEAAMLREVEEETGVVPSDFILAAVVARADATLHLFLVSAWMGGLVKNRAPDEHEKLAWFALDEARNLALPEVAYAGLFDALQMAVDGVR